MIGLLGREGLSAPCGAFTSLGEIEGRSGLETTGMTYFFFPDGGQGMAAASVDDHRGILGQQQRSASSLRAAVRIWFT